MTDDELENELLGIVYSLRDLSKEAITPKNWRIWGRALSAIAVEVEDAQVTYRVVKPRGISPWGEGHLRVVPPGDQESEGLVELEDEEEPMETKKPGEFDGLALAAKINSIMDEMKTVYPLDRNAGEWIVFSREVLPNIEIINARAIDYWSPEL
jgi:hypothetical protein